MKPTNFKRPKSYTAKHQYKVNDMVEVRWLGNVRLCTITKLTTTHIGTNNVATYSVTDMHDGLKLSNVGHNNEMEFGNVIRKIND